MVRRYRRRRVIVLVRGGLVPCLAIVRRSTAFRGRMVNAARPTRLLSAALIVSLLLPVALQVSPAHADPVGSDRSRAQSLAAQLEADNVRDSELAEAYDQAA